MRLKFGEGCEQSQAGVADGDVLALFGIKKESEPLLNFWRLLSIRQLVAAHIQHTDSICAAKNPLLCQIHSFKTISCNHFSMRCAHIFPQITPIHPSPLLPTVACSSKI